MTEIELRYPRAEAIELVAAAFENVRSLSEYEVDAEDGTVVGRTDGGVTSFGEEIRVAIAEDEVPERTTITVTAAHRVSFNRNSNPWKYKAEFVDELNDLRGRPVEELRPDPSSVSGESEGVGAESGTPPESGPDPTAEALHRGTRIILYLLLGALGLMIAITAAALAF